MLNSEITSLLSNWYNGWPNVFKIRYTFFDPDTLVIVRKDEDTFTVDLERSTTKYFKEFTKEQLIKRLKDGSLEHLAGHSTTTNYNSSRTNGCTCGAWNTRNPDNHSPICNLYKRGME